MTQTLKLGKAPAKYDPKLIHLSQFETTTTPPKQAPIGFGHYKTISADWGMLGNDSLGDCVWAGSAHETMILTKLAGPVAVFSNASVISDYSACAGYNPANPNSDQGTDMGQAMSYRRNTGIADAYGKRHLVGAYMGLEPGNWTQLLEALYAFEVVGIGIEFPQSAMDQFNAGQPWSVVKGNSPIEGGHYIPVVGRPNLNYVEVVTWGTAIRMTKAFYQKYNDESYAFVSQEDLTNGKSIEGYDMTALSAILAKL